MFDFLKTILGALEKFFAPLFLFFTGKKLGKQKEKLKRFEAEVRKAKIRNEIKNSNLSKSSRVILDELLARDSRDET